MNENLSPKEILVVDDDPDYVDLIRLRLETSGYQVSCVSNGLEALNLLEKSYRPDLIVLDIEMPDKNGLTTLINLNVRRLREKNESQIPIIVATGLRSEAIRSLLTEQKISAYLTKPYDAGELIEKIHRLI